MSETRRMPEWTGGEDESLRLRPGLILFVITVVALVLRLFHYAGRSLWTDEFATYWVAMAPTWRECALRAAETQGMSPFYFFLERVVLTVLPNAEWSLRGLSLVASLATVAVMYHLAIELFKDEQTGLVAALILALHEMHIYYAQEARPYALAMLCALLSQWWFLRWLRGGRRMDRLAYVLASVCLLFSHYLFLPLILAQNLWYFYLRREKGGNDMPSVEQWWQTQGLIGLALLVQAVQMLAILGERAQWNWLPPMTWTGLTWRVMGMLDWKIVVIAAVFFLVFRFTERLPIRESLRRRRDEAVLLGLWLTLPIVFVYGLSLAAGVSLLDDRYLMLSLLAFQLLLARFLCSFRSSVMRATLPGAYVVLYLGMVLIPNFLNHGHFARPLLREYNWRGAMAFMAENFEPGDLVLLRSGEIKENWVPDTDNPRIIDYARMPFRSFYWRDLPMPEILTLTYTMEARFEPYYDRVFAEVASRPRVWMIGVDPPNTNYPLANVLPFLEAQFPVVRFYEADYGGVYLALFGVIPPPDDVLVVPDEDDAGIEMPVQPIPPPKDKDGSEEVEEEMILHL